MKKYFTLSTPERANEVRNAGSVYSLDLRTISAQRLFELSKGFTLEACEVMRGNFLAVLYKRDAMRFYPLRENFTRDEWAKVEKGDFNAGKLCEALGGRYFSKPVLTEEPTASLCLSCGVVVKEDRKTSHKCGERFCRCGGLLKTAYELSANECEKCARGRFARLHPYHGRDNRSAPLFEKPDKREAVPHLGFEIEAEGGGNFYANNDNAKRLANILNGDENAFKPLAEFETDGSINDGIETIFRPLTCEGLSRREGKLQRFYEHIKTRGGLFGRVNGLHCHIDRDFFGARGTEERAKGAILLETMVYKFYDFFALISRRKAGRFGYAYKKESVKGVLSACLNIADQTHSYAVNGSGSNTIEVRIFGGAIDNARDFLAVADIVQGLARWAKNATLTGAERATPCAIVPYIRNAERVLSFVTNTRSDAPNNGCASIWLDDFKKALTAKIN